MTKTEKEILKQHRDYWFDESFNDGIDFDRMVKRIRKQAKKEVFYDIEEEMDFHCGGTQCDRDFKKLKKKYNI